jgi:exosome complex protein LRP1
MPRTPQNVRVCARARARSLSYLIISPLNRYHTGQVAIDRAAATRFIKHAIAQAKDAPPNNSSGPGPGPGPSTHVRPIIDGDTASAVRAPIKVTEKMLEREQYHEALREEDALADEEELEGGGLAVIDGEEPDGPSESDDVSPRPNQATESELEATADRGKDKGKGKAKAMDAPITTLAPDDAPPSDTKIPGKRRRPAIDPFAGSCIASLAHISNIYLNVSSRRVRR